MSSKPVIVVSAFNRPASLQRLLDSLQTASYPDQNITLHISIDKSESDEVTIIAKDFHWKHGSKEVHVQPNHLGLKSHILNCGDLTNKYETIILLEDDLLVSPHFYQFALESLAFYKDEKQIAGISLYNYQVAESCFYPFQAMDDGSDVYFMQVASSWGQLWTQQQWNGFRKWLVENPHLTTSNSIPGYLQQWGENSWKKHFIHYLIASDKYFVFPRLSLTTNFEDKGTHAAEKKVFHVSLQHSQKEFKFEVLNRSKAVYDAWFEMLPLCLNKWQPGLSKFDYAVDLYGCKEIDKIKTEFVLTSKTGNEPVLSFAMDLFPLESNLALDLKGDKISLYRSRNNKFRPAKLNMQNLLEERALSKHIGFSVVLTIDVFDQTKLNKSLISIRDQNYSNLECLIISGESVVKDVQICADAFEFKITLLSSDESLNLAGKLGMGFKDCKQDVITWINQGSAYSTKALQRAASIFSNSVNVNWIMGADESIEDSNAEAVYNSSKIRINGNDAYRACEKGALEPNLELNFFKRGAIQTVANYRSFHEIFLGLISIYQRIGVVFQFGLRDKKMREVVLSPNEKENLLKDFKQLKQYHGSFMRILNFVFRGSFKKNRKFRMVYPLLNNYPDVLRFDPVNKTYYFNKL